MIPTRSSLPSRNAFTILAASVLAAFVAFGCSDQADPTGPGGLTASLIQQSSDVGQVTIELRQGNTRYAGVLVTLVNNQLGPFNDAGALLKDTTNQNGVVTFTDVPVPGQYCAHITAISDLDDATAFGDFIVPITDQAGSSASIAPAITARQGGGGNVTLVPLTEPYYVTHCVKTTASTAPIVLTTQRPQASVRLSPGQGASLNIEFKDLLGASVQPPSWLVIGETTEEWRKNFEWLAKHGVPDDVHPGILVGVPAVQGQGNGVLFRGLPPGRAVALEALAQGGGGQGLLVATGRRTVPSSGTGQESFEMEPLMCVLERKNAAPGTATGGALEIAPWVKDGFLATAAFDPRSAISIWYDVQGDGSDALQMRFKNAAGQTRNLNVSYSCTNGTCSAGTPSGSSGATVRLFQKDSEAGRIQLTWLIESLPFSGEETSPASQRLASAEYSFRDFPEASKDDQTRAFSPIALPDFTKQCEVDQSNDPRWWIGN